jgi:hypothetical protein
VVGDGAAAAFGFLVGLEPGTLGRLGSVLFALAVEAAGFASDGAAAPDAVAE